MPRDFDENKKIITKKKHLLIVTCLIRCVVSSRFYNGEINHKSHNLMLMDRQNAVLMEILNKQLNNTQNTKKKYKLKSTTTLIS